MNKLISDLLNSILKTISIIDELMGKLMTMQEIKNDNAFREKIHEIKKQYQLFSSEGLNEFYSYLDMEFASEDLLKIYLLSIVLKAVHSTEIIERIVQILDRGHLSVYQSVIIEFQIAKEINENHIASDVYDLRRKLHTMNSNRWIKEIAPPADYIPYKERNKNRIVILTEQILSANHAPTKITLDLCKTLRYNLGMEVLLISCPIGATAVENDLSWFDLASDNYYDFLDGNYEVSYIKDKIIYKPKGKSDYFLINYKESKINGLQILFDTVNSSKLQALLQSIYEFNPAFVYDMDCIQPLADACACFTTVVSGAMNYGLPVSNAQILLALTKKDEAEETGSEITFLEEFHQAVIKDTLYFTLDEPKEVRYRSDYQIPQDIFLISMVGNRLAIEITNDFLAVLKEIILLDQRIGILLIGESKECKGFFQDPCFKDRMYYLGYQTNLIDVIGISDVYLNPPRKGGGTSALIALKAGVPVITLPEGDVAGNVGREFVCTDNTDMLQMIRRYMNDREYYKKQKQLGLDYTKRLTDLAANVKNKINKIMETIAVIEGD